MHDEPALAHLARPSGAQVIGVIPAVLMKRIGHHRRAEQKLNGAAGHADRYLINRVFLDQIALLDVDSVNAAARDDRSGKGA